MKRYRKKPVVIEAVQFGGYPSEIVSWCGGTLDTRTGPTGAAVYVIAIDTLEGTMLAFPGDWIIKGVQGEFYPCKPDIFQATYEEVV